MKTPVEDPLESMMQEIIRRGEETFLSLVNSPMFADYSGLANQLSEEELRSLYGLMMTSLCQTRINMEESIDSGYAQQDEEIASIGASKAVSRSPQITLS